MLRGVEIEPDDVAQFLNEVLVVGQLEGTYKMRLELMRMPDALNGGVAHPSVLGHGTGQPMRGLLGGPIDGDVDDALDNLSPVVSFLSPSRSVDETRQAVLSEASSPFRHRIRAGDHLLGDVTTLQELGGQQNDTCSEHLTHVGPTRTHGTLQGGKFLATKLNGWGAAYATLLLDVQMRESNIIFLNCVTLHGYPNYTCAPNTIF